MSLLLKCLSLFLFASLSVLALPAQALPPIHPVPPHLPQPPADPCRISLQNYDCVVKSFELTARDQALSPAFLATAGAQALKQATVLFMFRSSREPAGRAYQSALMSAERSPAESLSAIQFALSRLTAAQQAERIFLMQEVSRLEVANAQRFAVLRAEVARGPEAGVSPSAMLSARLIAVERASQFADTVAAKVDLERTIDRVVVASPAPADRAIILKQYERADGPAARRIALQHGIAIPVRRPIHIPPHVGLGSPLDD